MSLIWWWRRHGTNNDRKTKMRQQQKWDATKQQATPNANRDPKWNKANDNVSPEIRGESSSLESMYYKKGIINLVPRNQYITQQAYSDANSVTYSITIFYIQTNFHRQLYVGCTQNSTDRELALILKFWYILKITGTVNWDYYLTSDTYSLYMWRFYFNASPEFQTCEYFLLIYLLIPENF